MSAQNRPTLVVGGTSRLGQMLSAFWPDGAPLDCSARHPKSDFVVFDLMLEPDKARQAMQGVGAVICLAGITPARASAADEGFSRNSDLALACIRAAHSAGAGRVFLASSAAVYGAAGGVLQESDLCAPVAEYGRAKLAMEEAALALARDLDHPVTILRIGNVAGADAILGGWRAGMQIDQLPDASTPKRSYIGPRTLAHVLHRLSQTVTLPEVLNIATPAAVEMGALLNAAGLAWAPRPAHASVIADVTLSTKQLEQHVHFASEDSTPEGLAQQWRTFLAKQASANGKP